MSLSTGIDITHVKRFEQNATDDAFLDRLLTSAEKRYVLAAPIRWRQRRCAEIFAAKEAVMKAIGTGWNHGIGWKDIEITRSGSFEVTLGAMAQTFANNRRIFLSLSSTRDAAVAFAVAEKANELPDNNPRL